MKEKISKLFLAKTHDYSASKKPKLAAVMIHGIAADSTAYDQALKYLESQKSLSNIRFITFDLLGSGKSLKSDDLNYDYDDQLGALRNSIEKLNLDVPLVLIGHSLGTFIVTHYANKYKDEVMRLILISPPVYTERDFMNPAFRVAIKMFKDAVSEKKPKILEEKAFKNSMEKIALNRHNYHELQKLKTPTNMIYGEKDQIIASFNLPKLLKTNQNLNAIKTDGQHGITYDKYSKLVAILEDTLNAQNL